MKIGILTFHASHNYGSMLQAYALLTYLASIGHDVYIINLRPDAQRKMYQHPSPFINPSLKKIIKTLLAFGQYKDNVKKWNLFEKFMDEQMRLTDGVCRNVEDVKVTIEKYDFEMLICGGDQIWNQKCKDFEPSFLLPFDISGVKKISYSPSMGKQAQAMMREPYSEIYLKSLKYFDAISVREPDAAELLSLYLKRQVEVIADPTFLMLPGHYKKLLGKPIIDGHYMFYYTPSHIRAELAYKASVRFSQEKGLKLISSNSNFRQKDIIPINQCGPIEFLNLLYYADFVCGQSFHLVVFSLLFHKDFAALNGDIDPRMSSLLDACRCSDRGVNLKNPDFTSMKDIDYHFVDNHIDEIRKKAMNYINKNVR